MEEVVESVHSRRRSLGAESTYSDRDSEGLRSTGEDISLEEIGRGTGAGGDEENEKLVEGEEQEEGREKRK